MTTPTDIINLALKDIGVVGVGQTALAEDTNDAFKRMQWMISQWQRKRWLIPMLMDVAFTSTGATSYTIGNSTNSPAPVIPLTSYPNIRPDRLEDNNFARQLNPAAPYPIDFPLKLIHAREDYNELEIKALPSFPSYIFYSPDLPNGSVYVWPIPPASQWEIHLNLKGTLQALQTVNDTFTIPDEYFEAILYNLEARLLPAYQKEPDPTITALALAGLSVIRGENTAIPHLDMPSDLSVGGVYNIFSDQTR